MKKPSSNRSHTKKRPVESSVRIIGGQFKRRPITFVDTDGLRPTPDRLRETLFNWLLTDIHGAQVLDSCAGSGVLGFEALSRGALHCTFIEPHPTQSQVLLQSAEQLKIDQSRYHIIQGAAEQILGQEHTFEKPFDIVFIDPPYAKDLWQPILTALVHNQLITTDTLIYLESDKDLSAKLEAQAQSLNTTLCGQKRVQFERLKQSKVGQVVAGLYSLTSS